MSKNTPKARAVRTFFAGLAGVAVTASTLNFFADWKASTAQLAIGVGSAALAGATAYVQASGDLLPHAKTPLGKAFATFCQMFAPGLGAIAVTEFTTGALVSAGASLVRAALSSAFAAAASFFTNQAEDES